jgi:hypothetical protein
METWQRRSRQDGQALVEMAIVLPLLMVTVLGVVELGYALLDQHVVTKLTREGSNLISRDVTLLDAGTAVRGMTTRPVNFDVGSRLIFSVLKKVSTVGAPNFGQIIVYQRHEVGALAASSTLRTAGIVGFGPAPDFQAVNSDTDVRLQVVSLPPSLDIAPGGMLYVTEVFTSHPLITPLDRFGITVPPTLHSIAYF